MKMEMENKEFKEFEEVKEKKSNKQVITISIIAVVLLVVAILSTSYAMFTANLTGTKENKLNTGYVTMSCEETVFSLPNTDVMTDEQGIAATDNAATCALNTTMSGNMLIGYDIALADVDLETPDDDVNTENVKIQAFKTVDSATTYLAGSSETAGVLVSSIAGSTGTYDSSITSYNLDTATVQGTSTINYTVKAWVSSLPANVKSTTNDICTDSQYTDQASCEAAGEIWGDSQTEKQEGGTFSFKLKVGATQTFED